MAVDWFLLGMRALNVIEAVQLTAVVAIVVAIVVGAGCDWRSDRCYERAVREHPSNVVQLYPCRRPYDWQANGDAS